MSKYSGRASLNLIILCRTDACKSRTLMVLIHASPPGWMNWREWVTWSNHWNVSMSRRKSTRVVKPPVLASTSATPGTALFSPMKPCRANPRMLAAPYRYCRCDLISKGVYIAGGWILWLHLQGKIVRAQFEPSQPNWERCLLRSKTCSGSSPPRGVL